MKKIPPVLQKILMERAATASRKNEPGDGYGYGIDVPHGYEVNLPSSAAPNIQSVTPLPPGVAQIQTGADDIGPLGAAAIKTGQATREMLKRPTTFPKRLPYNIVDTALGVGVANELYDIAEPTIGHPAAVYATTAATPIATELITTAPLVAASQMGSGIGFNAAAGAATRTALTRSLMQLKHPVPWLIASGIAVWPQWMEWEQEKSRQREKMEQRWDVEDKIKKDMAVKRGEDPSKVGPSFIEQFGRGMAKHSLSYHP